MGRTHGEAASETKCGVDGPRRFRSSCMKTPIQLLSLTSVSNSVTCDGCLSLQLGAARLNFLLELRGQGLRLAGKHVSTTPVRLDT